ncbi:MAG TPA: acylneuraminate cytidylyltransferase family protein [Patescibacteria group bacterium]|nr:acylneuraminate cytidylyltransferase family protein [Patescibacteria group bacterium]
MKQLNILGVITARGNSKGLPGKNIKMLGGRPLILYTLAQARFSKTITHLITSTDSREIAHVVQAAGGDVPFLRPPALATDTATHTMVLEHAITYMERMHGLVYDYIVTLQPTSPFRAVSDIDLTVEKIIAQQADSAITIAEVEPNRGPQKMFEKDVDGNFRPLVMAPHTRRQEVPKYYMRTSAVFVTKRDVILEKQSMFGDSTAMHVVPAQRSVDIDTPLDFHVAEYMFHHLPITPDGLVNEVMSQ